MYSVGTTTAKAREENDMPIAIINWIMVLSLILTFIILNLFENRRMKNSGWYLESDRRFEKDRRHFTYATHIPERRSGFDRRLVQNR